MHSFAQNKTSCKNSFLFLETHQLTPKVDRRTYLKSSHCNPFLSFLYSSNSYLFFKTLKRLWRMYDIGHLPTFLLEWVDAHCTGSHFQILPWFGIQYTSSPDNSSPDSSSPKNSSPKNSSPKKLISKKYHLQKTHLQKTHLQRQFISKDNSSPKTTHLQKSHLQKSHLQNLKMVKKFKFFD